MHHISNLEMKKEFLPMEKCTRVEKNAGGAVEKTQQ
jgi:hypothetical protein